MNFSTPVFSTLVFLEASSLAAVLFILYSLWEKLSNYMFSEISYIKEITLKSMSLVKFTYMTSRPSIQLPIFSRPLTVLKMPKKKLESKLIFSALSFSWHFFLKSISVSDDIFLYDNKVTFWSASSIAQLEALTSSLNLNKWSTNDEDCHYHLAGISEVTVTIRSPTAIVEILFNFKLYYSNRVLHDISPCSPIFPRLSFFFLLAILFYLFFYFYFILFIFLNFILFLNFT